MKIKPSLLSKISNSDSSAFNKIHRILSLKSKEFHPNSPNLHPTKEEKYSKKSGNEDKKKVQHDKSELTTKLERRKIPQVSG